MMTVAKQISNTIYLNYDAPIVTSILPTNGPVAGNIPILVIGVNFGLSPVVNIGGVICPILNSTHIRIFCLLPSGSNINLPVIVTASDQSSLSTVTFSYNTPHVCLIFY